MPLLSLTRILGGLICCVVLLAAMRGRDEACGEAKPLHLRAPAGAASATRYARCGPGSPHPHVLLRFRGGGEGREFVLAEQVFVTRMRWLSPDQLEVAYRTKRPTGTRRDRIVRAGGDSVRVIYLGRPGRVRGQGVVRAAPNDGR